jgi:hypothetical protein
MFLLMNEKSYDLHCVKKSFLIVDKGIFLN